MDAAAPVDHAAETTVVALAAAETGVENSTRNRRQHDDPPDLPAACPVSDDDRPTSYEQFSEAAGLLVSGIGLLIAGWFVVVPSLAVLYVVFGDIVITLAVDVVFWGGFLFVVGTVIAVFRAGFTSKSLFARGLAWWSVLMIVLLIAFAG